MPLPLERTTTVTEAIENSTRAWCTALDALSQKAELLVSNTTRNGGSAATGAGFVADASDLWVTWLRGASEVARTFVDNLVLITSDTPRYWTSGLLTHPGPAPGQPWTLVVGGAKTAAGEVLDPAAITLFHHVDNTLLGAAPDRPAADWTGSFRAVLRKLPYVPGLVELQVSRVNQTAVAASSIEAPVSVLASMSVDPALLNP